MADARDKMYKYRQEISQVSRIHDFYPIEWDERR